MTNKKNTSLVKYSVDKSFFLKVVSGKLRFFALILKIVKKF